jgi:hypothetical protein
MAFSPAPRSSLRVLLWLLGSLTVVGLIRLLRGFPSPAFADDALWKGGASWPPLTDEPEAVDLIDLTTPSAPRPGMADLVSHPDELVLDSISWVEPFEGDCPPGYPVKGKLASGIYHPPGGAAYERTRPDRCYRDEAAAAADGLRAAKR